MIVSMAIATIGFSYAQQDQGMQQEQQQMETIEIDKLPNEVQQTLQTEQFKDWNIEEAYEIEEGVGDYAVKVKRGDEARMLHFSEDGNLIRQEEVGGDSGPDGQDKYEK